MKQCFLLSGWSGSGKDAVGQILMRRYGAKRFAFADRLKEMVAEQYKFPVQWAHTTLGKQVVLACGKTVREVLFTEGQLIRQISNEPELFAQHVANQILADADTQIFCITDWRLPIEHNVLSRVCFEHGIRLLKVRIRRDGQLQSDVNHPETEEALQRWIFDIYLTNPGESLDALEESIRTSKFADYMEFLD
jgi:hypothetical protein